MASRRAFGSWLAVVSRCRVRRGSDALASQHPLRRPGPRDVAREFPGFSDGAGRFPDLSRAARMEFPGRCRVGVRRSLSAGWSRLESGRRAIPRWRDSRRRHRRGVCDLHAVDASCAARGSRATCSCAAPLRQFADLRGRARRRRADRRRFVRVAGCDGVVVAARVGFFRSGAGLGAADSRDAAAARVADWPLAAVAAGVVVRVRRDPFRASDANAGLDRRRALSAGYFHRFVPEARARRRTRTGGTVSFDFLRYVRDVPDFPRKGIVFKDLTPLLADGRALAAVIDALVAPFRDAAIERVIGIEARGFIFGATAACALGAGFVPMRKPGKLPATTIGIDYALEYGSDRLEMHADALVRGERVLIVDDVLATCGTL